MGPVDRGYAHSKRPAARAQPRFGADFTGQDPALVACIVEAGRFIAWHIIKVGACRTPYLKRLTWINVVVPNVLLMFSKG